MAKKQKVYWMYDKQGNKREVLTQKSPIKPTQTSKIPDNVGMPNRMNSQSRVSIKGGRMKLFNPVSGMFE